MTLGDLKRLVEQQGKVSRYASILADLIDRFGEDAEVTEETVRRIRKRVSASR